MDLLKKIEQKTAVICIIGLGYVGLPTSLIFAKKGFRVIGVDILEEKVDIINSGISPIHDTFLQENLPKQLESGNFNATTEYQAAVSNADIILLMLPTPANEAKEPDLTFVVNATTSVAKYLRKGQLVILESTVYPGVTEEIVCPILEKSGLEASIDFGLAYCPERFNPGDTDRSIEKVTRVIGGINTQWTEIANALYSQIQLTFSTVDIKTAEASKVIENAQRDLNIAFANEMALICEHLSIDFNDVFRAASTKWNFVRYYPGPGVGGHCLPHDPYYLVKKAREHGYHAQIILAGRKVNDFMPHHVMDLLVRGLNHNQKAVKGSKIIIFGATYKKNIDDLRTSPTELLVNYLRDYEAEILIIEPYVERNLVFGCKRINQANSQTISEADALIFMVNHDEFSDISTEYIKSCFEGKKGIVIVDGVRMLNGYELKESGFFYFAVGAGKINTSYRG